MVLQSKLKDRRFAKTAFFQISSNITKSVPGCQLAFSAMSLVNPRISNASGRLSQGLRGQCNCFRTNFGRGYAQKTFRSALVDKRPSKNRPLSPLAGVEIPSFTPGKRKWTFSFPYASLNNYEKASNSEFNLNLTCRAMCCRVGPKVLQGHDSHRDQSWYRATAIYTDSIGLGIFTRALFNQINPKNYVIFDRHMICKKNIIPLVEASKGVIKHFDLDGWDFNAYSEVIKRKLVNPEVQDSSRVNSSFLFVGNFTESNLRRADGLVAQLIPFMFHKIFLYHFGRVKTLIWMQSPGWQSLVANPGHITRKKITVLREITCEARVLARNENRSIISRLPRAFPTTKDPVGSKEEDRDDILTLENTDFSPYVNF
jgi:hypothetical protein